MEVLDIPLKTLRESIGFVTQESIIFSDTIGNNVLFGRSGFSQESLEAALKAAEIYDEIQALENGMDTVLGERGVTLSGGQRQRLTIARALLSDPPILILDDALSMVDTRTEERILNKVLEFRAQKISRADFVVVLDGGKLVEVGDHRTLMDRGNEYARLYEKQLLAKELELGAT
jgi:ATP-binding cassette subfamily B protein